MIKVNPFDSRVRKRFLELASILSVFLSFVLIFIDVPPGQKSTFGVAFLIVLIAIYAALWFRYNTLEKVTLVIEGSDVVVAKRDIFQQKGFKAIAFNEYFDTEVDDIVISKNSLNGIFITDHLDTPKESLDEHLAAYPFDEDDLVGENEERKVGKKSQFRLGTVCLYRDYILTAFSRFDEKNRAWLTMPDYLEFLIRFWDNVNRVYSQKSVSVPIFGSGITRIKEHKNISDEELLKIMLWTFRISETRFKYPAKLTIVIHPAKMDRINLLDIKIPKNGL